MNPRILRPRLAVGALVQAMDTGRILLGRRSRLVGRPGLWALFGGGVEPGEAAVDAAVRELAEEAGIRCLIVGELGSSSPAFRAFHGLVPCEIRPRLNWENDMAGWFDPWDLPEPLHEGTVELAWQVLG